MKEEEDLQIELDAKIREWEKKIKGQHKNMGGCHMSAQHTTQMEKTKRVLDNRLDQVRNCQHFQNVHKPMVEASHRKDYLCFVHANGKETIQPLKSCDYGKC